MRRAALLWCLLIPVARAGCTCELALSACHETASTEVIFAGTVEAVKPSFLDPWNASQQSSLTLLNQEYARAQNDRSPGNVARLRDAYLKIFPDLPDEHKRVLQTATTAGELANLFYWILDHGKRIRFKVRTVFRGKEEETLEVWTPFGDCGFNFQVGETYLVYADDDEESDVMTTGVCTRTRRLSDAGDDLAYLFFYHNYGDEAARLEGFVTNDARYQLDLNAAHYSDRVRSPVAGAILQLSSGSVSRYKETDAQGRFVFDGLAAREYTVAAFAPGYPAERHLLSGPNPIRIEKNACANQTLVVLKIPVKP